MVAGRPLQIVLCTLLVGLFVVSVVPGIAAPPPRPLCDACGDTFEATAASYGVALTVERSTATIIVHENGSATWVVRNHLADSASRSRLRTNATLRDSIAERAMWDTEFLGANVSDGGIVTLRYREADFAEQSVGGTLRSGAFTESYGSQNLAGLGADRLDVVAPAGMRFGWTVPDATLSENGRRMTLTHLDDDAFVTVVPQDAAFGSVLSALAAGSMLGPRLLGNGLVFIALPTAAFALFVWASTGVLSWRSRDIERLHPGLGRLLVATGALLTTGAVIAGGGGSLFGGIGAPLFGAGISMAALGVAFSRASVREQMTFRLLVVSAVLGVAFAAASTIAGAMLFTQPGRSPALWTGLPVLLPIFSLLPAGYAGGRGKRRRAISTAASGFVLALAATTPLLSPAFGIGLLALVVAMGYALTAIVVGTPLFVVGGTLADSPSTT